MNLIDKVRANGSIKQEQKAKSFWFNRESFKESFRDLNHERFTNKYIDHSEELAQLQKRLLGNN